MAAICRLRPIALLFFALALVAAAPRLEARSKPDPDKYAHKVQKKLAHFKHGALLRLSFVDGTESNGTLSQLNDGSFTFFNVESNTTETHRYADVESISKGSSEVGRRSHFHRKKGRV